jgi:hypothetical protein
MASGLGVQHCADEVCAQAGHAKQGFDEYLGCQDEAARTNTCNAIPIGIGSVAHARHAKTVDQCFYVKIKKQNVSH